MQSDSVVLSLSLFARENLNLSGGGWSAPAQRLERVQRGPRAAAQSAPSRALQCTGHGSVCCRKVEGDGEPFQLLVRTRVGGEGRGRAELSLGGSQHKEKSRTTRNFPTFAEGRKMKADLSGSKHTTGAEWLACVQVLLAPLWPDLVVR